MTFTIWWCHAHAIPPVCINPASSHGLGPCRCHGVCYSSWEGLLRSVFASWMQCFMDIWSATRYNKCILARNFLMRQGKGFWHMLVTDVFLLLRPLDATVEDAETQLCQIVDGFLGVDLSVKYQTTNIYMYLRIILDIIIINPYKTY